MAHDLRGLLRTASFGVTSIGAPLGAGSADWSRAAGLALLALFVVIALGWRRGGWERIREESAPAALILFSLLSSAMITLGRVSSGIPPLESRYIAYSSLAVIGAYLIVTLRYRRGEGPDEGRRWLAASLTLLIPGIVAANLHGLFDSRQWKATRMREKFLLQTAESQPDEALAGLYFVSELRRVVPYLRAERLGPFAEPQELLLLVRWREGAVTGEILPDSPIEQAFVCNVGELREAGVALATSGRKNRSMLRASLWEGERRIGEKTVPAEGLTDSGYLSIPLAEPMRSCQGRRLRFRLESPDASPGNAISAWTYPRYYAGELKQAGHPILPGRALGLELNAFHFGLMQ